MKTSGQMDVDSVDSVDRRRPTSTRRALWSTLTSRKAQWSTSTTRKISGWSTSTTRKISGWLTSTSRKHQDGRRRRRLSLLLSIFTGRRRPSWCFLLVDVDHWCFQLVDVDHWAWKHQDGWRRPVEQLQDGVGRLRPVEKLSLVDVDQFSTGRRSTSQAWRFHHALFGYFPWFDMSFNFFVCFSGSLFHSPSNKKSSFSGLNAKTRHWAVTSFLFNPVSVLSWCTRYVELNGNNELFIIIKLFILSSHHYK